MAGLFSTAPQEVVDYFDRRGTRVSWRWTDLASHEHALAFTVARTEGYDVIDTLREAVRKAEVERVPFKTFCDELIPKLKAKQWWGRITTADGTVELGSLRRLQTIYWANIRSAHAAGEWARTQETKDVLPYLTYKRTLSERARPEHLGWVGITLPVDDPWWRTHYPPNGWNCKCRVEQIGEVKASRVPADKRRRPKTETELWRDKVTGKVQRVPRGIDPGWQRNPGVTREIVAAALENGKLASMPEKMRSLVVGAIRTGKAFEAVVRAEGFDPKLRQQPTMKALGNLRQPIASTPASFIAAHPALSLGRVVTLRLERGHHLKESRRKAPLSLADMGKAEEVLAKADWTHSVGNRIEALALIDGEEWFVTVEVRDGFTDLVTLFKPDQEWAERARAGTRRRDQTTRKE